MRRAGGKRRELDRIETLVYDLLNITKFDAGTIVMERKHERVSPYQTVWYHAVVENGKEFV